MGEDMRQFLTFDCEGSSLAATLDTAPGETGLLVVSGGNEIRIGAHRGMVRVATDVAAAGYPVFRFDRRGIGDSEGRNDGFESSAADIASAITAFQAASPHLKRIVAYGNCDAATALVLHKPEGLSALVLSNPWVIEPVDDLPPPAAIKSYYLQRLRDPKAWKSLISGAVNLRNLAAGVIRVAAPAPPSALTNRVAEAMADTKIDMHVLLATGDGTAVVFADAWKIDVFAKARNSGLCRVTQYASSAHSFARAADYAVLKSALLESLSGN